MEKIDKFFKCLQFAIDNRSAFDDVFEFAEKIYKLQNKLIPDVPQPEDEKAKKLKLIAEALRETKNDNLNEKVIQAVKDVVEKSYDKPDKTVFDFIPENEPILGFVGNVQQ